jgi:hypothetical protein
MPKKSEKLAARLRQREMKERAARDAEQPKPTIYFAGQPLMKPPMKKKGR